MKLRKNMLWRVVLYFPIASFISDYISLLLIPFCFQHVTNPDGVVSVVVDPLKEGLLNGGLMLAVFLIGGLVFFRSMTRKEIVASAGILTAIEIILLLLAQVAPQLTSSIFNGPFWMIFSIFRMVASYIARVLPVPVLPGLIAAFTPMLFVVFGKKSIPDPQQK